jgi:type II secretory pathway pseudopilin PulG
MKHFRFKLGRKRHGGFSLVESVLSLGIMSFGVLALAPLLVLGLGSAHLARENRATAEIAASLFEQAKQGTLGAGPVYFDSATQPCGVNQAVYAVQPAEQPVAAAGGTAPLVRLILRVTPVGRPGAARTYADVFPTPPSP